MACVMELFDKYHLSIFRYLRRITGNQGLAEDLTQEVFLRVVRSLPQGLPDSKKGAWIFTLARNVMLNSRRDRARRPATDTLDGSTEPLLAAGQSQTTELDQALSRLEEVDREAFLMREVGGLGYIEIAEVCQITPDAVRSRIYRAGRRCVTLLLLDRQGGEDGTSAGAAMCSLVRFRRLPG